MWDGGTTRPSKDQTLKRIYTLSDTTQYSDCLETEGFNSRWEREIFPFSTALTLPMGVHPVPSDGKRGLGRKYFLVVKAAVIWNCPSPPSSAAVKNEWSYTVTTLLATQNKKPWIRLVMRKYTVVGLFQVPARYLSELRKTTRNRRRKGQSQGQDLKPGLLNTKVRCPLDGDVRHFNFNGWWNSIFISWVKLQRRQHPIKNVISVHSRHVFLIHPKPLSTIRIYQI
jgi:hypothetical protein